MMQQLPEVESVACHTWPQSPALKSSDTSGEGRTPLLPWMRQSRGPPAFWWIWSRTPEHHREKISGSPALFLLLKVNMKKIELLQSAKVLALNIQKHLKLRGGKIKNKKTESLDYSPPTVALFHLVYTIWTTPVCFWTPFLNHCIRYWSSSPCSIMTAWSFPDYSQNNTGLHLYMELSCSKEREKFCAHFSGGDSLH